MHQAVQRESKAARESAGILDASTLGKIDIQGSDASEFLNRVYTNAWSKLAIGKCRYGLMLNEDGMVYDDGVTTRLAENHYIMTTTTGGAANVLGKLEDYLQTEWPELDVYLTSVTDHYATASLCGPNSKKILKKIIPDLDLSDESFPHMSFKEAKIGNVHQRGVMNLAHNLQDVRDLKRRTHANRLNGIDAVYLSTEEVKKFCPIINTSQDIRYPVLGGTLQRRAGTARHDAVAWGYARGADAMGVDNKH